MHSSSIFMRTSGLIWLAVGIMGLGWAVSCQHGQVERSVAFANTPPCGAKRLLGATWRVELKQTTTGPGGGGRNQTVGAKDFRLRPVGYVELAPGAVAGVDVMACRGSTTQILETEKPWVGGTHPVPSLGASTGIVLFGRERGALTATL